MIIHLACHSWRISVLLHTLFRAVRAQAFHLRIYTPAQLEGALRPFLALIALIADGTYIVAEAIPSGSRAMKPENTESPASNCLMRRLSKRNTL